jgi:hypothetical protein
MNATTVSIGGRQHDLRPITGAQLESIVAIIDGSTADIGIARILLPWQILSDLVPTASREEVFALTMQEVLPMLVLAMRASASNTKPARQVH